MCMVRSEPNYFNKGATLSMMDCIDAVTLADAREVW